MTPDQIAALIPSEAVEAAAKALAVENDTREEWWPLYEGKARAAILATLEAWPGMTDMAAVCFVDGTPYPRVIHLPVTETANDRR